MSVMTIDDRAARSESAVEESEPMIMTKKMTMSGVARCEAAICGSRLLGSPPAGVMPA